MGLADSTMMRAYNGGQWDFIKGDGDYEQTWSLSKPELDTVLGDSEEGLKRLWCGSSMATRVHL